MAIEQNGGALQYVGSLRKNRDLTIKAVKKNGLSLQYSINSFRKDKDVVLQAIMQTSCAFIYADESLKKDKEYISSLAKYDSDVMRYAHKSIKKEILDDFSKSKLERVHNSLNINPDGPENVHHVTTNKHDNI